MSRIWNIISATVCAALLLASGACGATNNSARGAQDGTIAVTASINQWGTLAKELGGDLVTTTNRPPPT